MRARPTLLVILASLFVSGAALADEEVFVVRRHHESRECFRHLANGHCRFPRLTFGVDAGWAHFNESGPFGFNTSMGASTELGPSWGMRLGVDFTRWFGISAHYIGMYNRLDPSEAPLGRLGYLTSGFAGEFRFTVPIPFVQPYVFFGPGIYTSALIGDRDARLTSTFYDSTEFGMPIGVGVGIPIHHGVSIGAEATYHRFFNEAFNDDDEIGGGDLFTLNFAMKMAY